MNSKGHHDPKRRSVLRFEQAQLPTAAGSTKTTCAATMALYGGDLALVLGYDSEQITVFANSCLGLVSPLQGKVSVTGLDWSQMDGRKKNLLRSRIGRLSRSGNWLEQLTVLDNMVLPRAHHTRQPLTRLHAQAAATARALGLPGAPTALPAVCRQEDLQRAACAQAFLGTPVLVVLEEPVSGHQQTGFFGALLNLMRQARDRGAAIIWLTNNKDLWDNPTLPASKRYRLLQHELIETDHRT